jgi:enoyl-CoA hydratase/carnithine racemase
VMSVQEVFAQVLELGVPTVAALQGHTFAAGAMLALCHDARVMRADRGFFCLPEVDIRIPFSAGMSALVQARLTPQVAHEAMTTARRYGGTDAQAAAIVDVAASEGDVLKVALERAGTLAPKASPVLATIKQRMYAPVLAALRDAAANGLEEGAPSAPGT